MRAALANLVLIASRRPAEWQTEVTALRAYEASDLPGVVQAWNRALAGGANFFPLTEDCFQARVARQPSFSPQGLLVAAQGDQVTGFVHFGPATNFWFDLAERQVTPGEGLIWALVAPPSDRPLAGDLLGAAMLRLREAGARRILLYPSWVQCTQPFYNGIAGGYEMPGISASREEALALAADQGFEPIAEYGTPEFDLSDGDRLAALRAEAVRIRLRMRDTGLEPRFREVTSAFFPPRRAAVLVRGTETIATTAYGLWGEYAQAHGRRLYGITGVHVATHWRGLGLGKLIVTLALEAALAEGAEALHLHVYRANAPAWNLYHRAVGFQPRHTWLTLAAQV